MVSIELQLEIKKHFEGLDEIGIIEELQYLIEYENEKYCRFFGIQVMNEMKCRNIIFDARQRYYKKQKFQKSN